MIATFMVAMVTAFVCTSCGSDDNSNDPTEGVKTNVTTSNIIGMWDGGSVSMTFDSDGTGYYYGYAAASNKNLKMKWTLSGNTITINISDVVMIGGLIHGTETTIVGTVTMKNVNINSSNQLVGTLSDSYGNTQAFTGTYSK